jgi:hypothetical protein
VAIISDVNHTNNSGSDTLTFYEEIVNITIKKISKYVLEFDEVLSVNP